MEASNLKEYQLISCTGKTVYRQFTYYFAEIDLAPADIIFTIEPGSIVALQDTHIKVWQTDHGTMRGWVQYNYTFNKNFVSVLDAFSERDKKDFWSDYEWGFNE